MNRRIGYLVLAAGALLYVIAVVLASASPGPRAWGLHALGFLGMPAKILVLALLSFGVALSAAAAIVPPSRPQPQNTSPTRAIHSGYLVALLPAYAAVLWLLRTRTHFLGDGIVWLAGLREGDLPSQTEPLAQAIWLAASGLLRSIGAPIVSLALVSIACGVVGASLFWMIAKEIALDQKGFFTVFLLLLTMGVTGLFYGYIESYPPVTVAILAYLLAGLRYARRGTGLLLLVLTFSAAVASHLITLYLAPSLLFLVNRGQLPRVRRVVIVGLATALPVTILVLLGSGPSKWIHAFDIATQAARAGSAASNIVRPYPILSFDHAVDVANEVFLVIPVPFLLLLAAFAQDRTRGLRVSSASTFLAIAAGSGFAGALLLILPVAAAQDWDLFSTLLLPLGILGIWSGRSLYASGGRLIRVGLMSITLGSLLSFVLVNANERAGVRRYETLVGPQARVTDFARCYAYELLAHYYRHEHDYARAMSYIDLLLRTAPSSPRYWGMAGEALIRVGDFGEAIPYLSEAIRLNPGRATARTNLGICYTALKRYGDALGEFREAVRLDESRPDYRNNLGLAYYNIGSPDSALATWRETLRRWPGYRPAVQAMRKYFGISASPTAPRSVPLDRNSSPQEHPRTEVIGVPGVLKSRLPRYCGPAAMSGHIAIPAKASQQVT